nr:putative ABC transporter permease [uncultured Blautia sp.]
MNIYSGYELLRLFFAYSFLGWVLETVTATLKQRKFSNRGLVNGPFCVMYGITAILISVGLQELTGFWLFWYSVIYATVTEWIGGHLIEKAFKQRWWDYSEVKWNLDGYICVPASALWGVFGYIAVRWGNGLILNLLSLFPLLLLHIVLLVLVVLMIVDITASYLLLKKKGPYLEQCAAANKQLDKVSDRLTLWITQWIERRIQKAYPKVREAQTAENTEENVFAQGCGFYKLMLLFIIGAFLGDIVETVFCRITMGYWMSRSSLVWGPFSIVWGLALALVTCFLYKYKDRSESFLFLTGTFLGGAYEYLCSVFTEIFFGKVFWDYSSLPFNLGGRINLLYCFFWGIAAVVWFKKAYPFLSGLIAKIPVKPGKIITWILTVFMCCNIIVSSLALMRYDQRAQGVKAQNKIEKWVDTHFDDARMKQIYPKAKSTH